VTPLALTVEQVVDVVLVPMATTSMSVDATLLGNARVQLVDVQVPELALCAIPGIVKTAEAVSLPPSLPVATTVYALAVSDGTVKVQLKVPVAEVV